MWPSELSIVLQSAVKRAKSASTPGSHRSSRHSKQNRYVVNPNHLHLRKVPATQCVSTGHWSVLTASLTPVFPPQLWFGPYRHWWDDKERGTAIPAGRTSEDHHGKGIHYALLPSLTSHSHVILATWLVFEIACSACASTPLITEHSKAATCIYLYLKAVGAKASKSTVHANHQRLTVKAVVTPYTNTITPQTQ